MRDQIRHRDASVCAHSEMTGTYRSYGSLAHKGLGATIKAMSTQADHTAITMIRGVESEAFGQSWRQETGGRGEAGHMPNTIRSSGIRNIPESTLLHARMLRPCGTVTPWPFYVCLL